MSEYLGYLRHFSFTVLNSFIASSPELIVVLDNTQDLLIVSLVLPNLIILRQLIRYFFVLQTSSVHFLRPFSTKISAGEAMPLSTSIYIHVGLHCLS